MKPLQPAPRLADVPEEFAGARLDLLLAHWYPELSRARLQGWIRSGRVALDGAIVARPAQLLALGQRVSVDPPPPEAPESGPALEIPVLHLDEDVIAVDKPAGVLVHPREGGGRSDSIAEWAEARFGPLPRTHGEERPGVVHRLDGDTSGVLLLARTEHAATALAEEFRERRVKKTYLAFVQGDPRFASEWIDAPIERHPRSPERMRIAAVGTGRPSETYYEVRERFGHSALLECRPTTGRTHQIRVHLEHAGLPILGDRLYTGGRSKKPSRAHLPQPSRHALHASQIAFRHPRSGETLKLEAPLAADLVALREELKRVAW